ncbi:MAG: hypothetical protein LBG19_03285 [Prevotellaceae bacterium]|nr:hypothetical protein [Prevotellaceae bacterium]
MKFYLAILLFFVLLSCGSKNGGWQKVEVLDGAMCTQRHTECIADH